MGEPPGWRSVSAVVAVPPGRAWELLTDPDAWPSWGPTVRGATLDGPFRSGTTGRVTTSVGVTLPFTLRDVVPGRSWSWDVAGVRATSHHVGAAGPGRSRITFGVPPWALPYLVVCRLALVRLAHER